MLNRLYVLHALSPLHAGTGQGVGLIDLPIARERTTEHPLLPGSSVKGVLRAASQAVSPDKTNDFFGSERAADATASMIRISDARVFAFPVRSDKGTFAWVTCPYILLRLRRDAGDACGFGVKDVQAVADGAALVNAVNDVVDGNSITLDGLPFTKGTSRVDGLIQALAALAFSGTDDTSRAWNGFFTRRLVVVSDDSFTWFVNHATDVRAHIRIDPNTGTVARGALWYEETLPPETILVGTVQVGATRRDQRPEDALAALVAIAANPVQLGGNATTGAGQVRLSILGGAA